MGYQPRRSQPNRNGGYGKFLRIKNKDKKHLRKRPGRLLEDGPRLLTQNELVEVTLKRLHTLGAQKFGASPYSQYFDWWLLNVEAVLEEFRLHPEVGTDDQFVVETRDALSMVERQLEDRKAVEEVSVHDVEAISKVKAQLAAAEKEFIARSVALKARKRRELKLLNVQIEEVKREQDAVIRVKTGFFHLTSKKKREQKEAEIVEMLQKRQTDLELAMLSFSKQQRDLKDSYDAVREPLRKQFRNLQKVVGASEVDGSLEERWFACEALIDAVNSYLQRKNIKFQ